ncbi:TetR/AcrR family transcriptional regulator [Amycolatopsis saalfeldensis]|uniref:DNA-binding transcriptional regulator, AcrR family n=1 Tax=Amycolatopsis saalfeldensis TaxID=394193 RepID=A0A1H8U5V1_9PSEU|nr:TetR/AcrR family transcriptional regulator [Amycolatopsis saalfeldensis]SEO98551.1 DNA-binding transcriptional regulator, AcrR family [Amycolatopsis saalfeldensis]
MSEPPEAGPRGRPRDPRADEAILRAALELFIEHGPDGMSIEQVTERAGVARLTVYRRWPSKKELLIAALDQARGLDDVTLYQPFLNAGAEPTERELRVAVARLFETIATVVTRSDLRGLMARLIGTASSHPELLSTFWDSYLRPRRELAHAAIRRAVELGGLPATLDPELLIDTVVGATLFPALLDPTPPSEEELRGRMRAVCRQIGIEIPEPGAGTSPE